MIILDLSLIHHVREMVITSQSSTFVNSSSYNSLKAIDEVQDYDVDTCRCCSVTQWSSRSWWQINLDQKYLIGSLEIYGRHSGYNEQLENATIYASNSTMETSVSAGSFVYRIPNMDKDRNFLVNLTNFVIAKYFVVQLLNEVLTLCEFRLFEKECDIGRFGYGCLHQCHCSDRKACDSVTGNCSIPGCLSGWQGNACDKVCDSHTFGDACNTTCNCIDGSPCVHTNGTCIKGTCDPGWLLPTCSEECNERRFGEECIHTCKCVDGSTCNHINGKCYLGICEPGWLLPTCSEVCLHRSFGSNCSSECHCRDNTTCNPVSGECDGGLCDPGWSTSSCNVADANIIPLLADSIQTRMSSVASNRTSDLAIDGNIGPDPEQCKCCSETKNSQLSWWIVDFGETIPVSKVVVYSRNKENEFHHLDGFQLIVSKDLLYNSSSFRSSDTITSSKMFQISLPNILSRQIKIQRPGLLTLCEVQVFKGECETGTFGHGCSLNCHCADNQPCNQITGFCQTTACKTGWRGNSCDKYCLPDTFGDECKEVCFCEVGTCTSNYGICTGKCRPGYHGPHCNQVGTEEQTEHQTAVVGGAVGGSAALILVILVVAGVVLYRSRKQRRSTSKSYYDSPNTNITPAESPDYDTLDNLNDVRRSSNSDYENETVTGF